MPKLKDTHRYLIAGFTAITIFLLLAYFAPLVVMGGFLFLLFTIMSLAIGYIIIDSYDRWREDNDKNKSRKKAPSSKDAQQNSQISM